MKKTFIKVFSAVLSLLISVCVLSVFAFADGKSTSDGFEGEKSVAFKADASDVENFIPGGRAAIDLTLRKTAPSWLLYDLSSDSRDITLSLSFSFSSLSSYTERTGKLLTYDPTVLYSDFLGVTLIERHSVSDLLKFIETSLGMDEATSERSLSEIFTVTSNTVTVNGESFDLDDVTNIRPADAAVGVYQSLYVETCLDKKGTFTRTVTVFSAEDSEKVQESFKKHGKTTVTENGEISVSFSSGSFESLADITGQALRGIVTGSVKTTHSNKGESEFAYKESFDLEALLSEGGAFRYSFECPENATAVTSELPEVTVTEKTISTEGISGVEFSYRTPVNFSSVDILTDMSSPFGKISRKITYKMPLEFAHLTHEAIKKSFTKDLPDGITLTMTDDEEFRVYEFTFSTYSTDELSELSAAALKGKSKVSKEVSAAPFGSGVYTETLSVGKTVSGMSIGVESVTSEFILGSGEVIKAKKADRDFEKESSTVRFTSDDNSVKVEFEYKRFNVYRAVLYVAVTIVVAAGVIFGVLKIRQMRTKPVRGIHFSPVGSVTVTTGGSSNPPRTTVQSEAKVSPDATPTPHVTPTPPEVSKLKTTIKTSSEPSPKADTQKAEKFCRNCGNSVKEGEKFCRNCGTPVNS